MTASFRSIFALTSFILFFSCIYAQIYSQLTDGIQLQRSSLASPHAEYFSFTTTSSSPVTFYIQTLSGDVIVCINAPGAGNPDFLDCSYSAYDGKPFHVITFSSTTDPRSASGTYQIGISPTLSTSASFKIGAYQNSASPPTPTPIPKISTTPTSTPQALDLDTPYSFSFVGSTLPDHKFTFNLSVVTGYNLWFVVESTSTNLALYANRVGRTTFPTTSTYDFVSSSFGSIGIIEVPAASTSAGLSRLMLHKTTTSSTTITYKIYATHKLTETVSLTLRGGMTSNPQKRWLGVNAHQLYTYDYATPPSAIRIVVNSVGGWCDVYADVLQSNVLRNSISLPDTAPSTYRDTSSSTSKVLCIPSPAAGDTYYVSVYGNRQSNLCEIDVNKIPSCTSATLATSARSRSGSSETGVPVGASIGGFFALFVVITAFKFRRVIFRHCSKGSVAPIQPSSSHPHPPPPSSYVGPISHNPVGYPSQPPGYHQGPPHSQPMYTGGNDGVVPLRPPEVAPYSPQPMMMTQGGYPPPQGVYGQPATMGYPSSYPTQSFGYPSAPPLYPTSGLPAPYEVAPYQAMSALPVPYAPQTQPLAVQSSPQVVVIGQPVYSNTY